MSDESEKRLTWIEAQERDADRANANNYLSSDVYYITRAVLSVARELNALGYQLEVERARAGEERAAR